MACSNLCRRSANWPRRKFSAMVAIGQAPWIQNRITLLGCGIGFRDSKITALVIYRRPSEPAPLAVFGHAWRLLNLRHRATRDKSCKETFVQARCIRTRENAIRYSGHLNVDSLRGQRSITVRRKQ